MTELATAGPAIGSAPAAGEALAPSVWGRRAMWLSLLLITFVPPLLSTPGKYISDTRDPLWFATGTYLSRSLNLWQPSPFLGNEQHDGLLVPMGAFVGALRGVGVPLWVTERLWHGALLFLAAAAMVLLIDHLRGRKSIVAPLTAAVVFAFTPFTFGYGLPHTGTYAAYALAPLLLLMTSKGLTSTGVVASGAAFGLITFLMGGANGAPQLYALLPVGAFVIWMVAVDRSVRWRRALAFLGWASLFSVAMNAHWLVLLPSKEVANALAFTEQPQTINAASSFSESARGLGFWGFYGPWIPAVARMVTGPVFIVSTFALPLGALASAWRVRWRFRLFFLFLLLGSTALMVGLFPLSSPTPWGRFLLYAYGHVRGAAGVRTTYKVGSVFNLAVAALVGVGLEAWIERLRMRPAYARAAVAGVAALIIAANAAPVWTLGLYEGNRPVASIPGYWRSALADLSAHQDGYRSYFAPGALKPFYSWGELNGLAELPWISSVQWSPLPVGAGYGSDLLTAVEQPWQIGLPAQRTADLFRYLGVNAVVLQNDLDWKDSVTARPANLQTLLRDSSLSFAGSYGTPGQGIFTLSPHPRDTATLSELQLPPVQVLNVPDPVPVVRAEAGPPLVVSGDGFGLAALARDGMLANHPPILYSGNLTAKALAAMATQGASFVVTDSNRRRFWLFSPVQRSYSHTYPADQPLPPERSFGLFGDRTDTQTVAVYHGAASITASGYGSPFEFQPEFRPVNAFDGNLTTAWLTGTLVNPIGAWIRITFDRPREVAQVGFDVPGQTLGRWVRRVRLDFSDGSSVTTDLNPKRTIVRFDARETSSLKVTILDVTPGVVNTPVGFSEIEVPGVVVQELIRVPDDLIRVMRETVAGRVAVEGIPVTYLFDRARTNKYLGGDEEVGIVRQFETAGSRAYALRGTVHLQYAVPDDVIDRLIGAGGGVTATSSGRFLGAVRFRASQALDGRTDTEWAPEANVGAWMRADFPRRVIARMTVRTDVTPGRRRIQAIAVSFSDGSEVRAEAGSGGVFHLRFPRRAVSWARITILGVTPPTGFRGPVAITEVTIPGVTFRTVPADAPVPCYEGPAFALDGVPTPVQVSGTVRELLAGTEQAVSPCGGGPLPLTEGVHELAAGGVLQPDTLILSTALTPGAGAAATASSAPPPPATEAHPTGGAGYDVDVKDAVEPFYLVIGQNDTTKWHASVGGEDLGPPLLLDGYSAGWRIERAGSFTVHVRYGPQATYRWLLVLSLLAVASAAMVLGATALRRRRR